jgi:hypothetical protein
MSEIAGVVPLFGFVRSERKGRRAFVLRLRLTQAHPPIPPTFQLHLLYFLLSPVLSQGTHSTKYVVALSPLLSPHRPHPIPRPPYSLAYPLPNLPLVYFSVTTGLRSPHHI